MLGLRKRLEPDSILETSFSVTQRNDLSSVIVLIPALSGVQVVRAMRWLPLCLFSVYIALCLPSQGEEGRRISVGNHSLFLDCTGIQKGATVILLAGAGNDTTAIWDKVQPKVATFAPVCSYDRMGMGQSDHLPRKQSEAEIVEDLHQLLRNAKIPPPYVLVGHSMGGIYARKFAETYPNTVAGFVFVDSAHEEEVWRYATIAPMLLSEFEEWPNWGKLQDQGWLLPGSALQWQSDVPLIVLEHGIMWPRGTFKGMSEGQYQDVQDTWHAMQVDLSRRSKYGGLRIAEKSGHYIQTRQPGIVTDAILDVVSRLTH